jgi:hypothetical protein
LNWVYIPRVPPERSTKIKTYHRVIIKHGKTIYDSLVPKVALLRGAASGYKIPKTCLLQLKKNKLHIPLAGTLDLDGCLWEVVQ